MTMRALALAVGIATGVALTGCTTSPPRMMMSSPKKIDCNGSVNCEVNVAVQCPSSPCTLQVDFDLVLLHNGSGNNFVTWKLDPHDFEFMDNGIVIDPQTFDCSKDGKWKFKCKAKKQTNDAYKYNINVKASAGSPPVDPLDPWVVNN